MKQLQTIYIVKQKLPYDNDNNANEDFYKPFSV